MVLLLHRPSPSRSWYEWVRRRAQHSQRERVWWNDQGLSPGKRCVSGAAMNQTQDRGVGGQGYTGSVRLAPARSLTKEPEHRTCRVQIKVSGVGQAGRKTGMSCGLPRANWKRWANAIEEENWSNDLGLSLFSLTPSVSLPPNGRIPYERLEGKGAAAAFVEKTKSVNGWLPNLIADYLNTLKVVNNAADSNRPFSTMDRSFSTVRLACSRIHS